MLIKIVGIIVLMATSTIVGVIAVIFHVALFIARRAKLRAGQPKKRDRIAYRAHLDEVERFLMATQRQRDLDEAELA